MDKNDNRPVFDASMYVFDVEENQLRFNFAKVNAHDADSNENNNNVIKYKILSKNNITFNFKENDIINYKCLPDKLDEFIFFENF